MGNAGMVMYHGAGSHASWQNWLDKEGREPDTTTDGT
jgi:hypothetical protein